MNATPTSNPALPIAELKLPAPGGAIGMCSCPGRATFFQGFAGPRNLEQDLATIASWGAEAVVTLLPEYELESAGVGSLGDAVEARGIDWHHLPISDISTPGADFEAAWNYSGLRLRRTLAHGGRIVVHCMAGMGRTGTIAARLLVESGWSSADAISAVRSVRPGTIETPGQLAHVRAAASHLQRDERADRFLGALLGGAVGAAFGAALAGSAWGERHGVSAIPHALIRRLEDLPELLELGAGKLRRGR